MMQPWSLGLQFAVCTVAGLGSSHMDSADMPTNIIEADNEANPIIIIIMQSDYLQSTIRIEFPSTEVASALIALVRE